MQFLAIVSLFALSAIAAPTTKSPAAIREASFESALSDLKNLQENGCSIIKCAAALAPTVVGCAAAAAQEFIDPISDIGCIAGAGNAIANEPSSCSGCF